MCLVQCDTAKLNKNKHGNAHVNTATRHVKKLWILNTDNNFVTDDFEVARFTNTFTSATTDQPFFWTVAETSLSLLGDWYLTNFRHLSSVQDGIYALGKALMRSTPSLIRFPNIAFEMVLMLVWLTMALSRPFKEDRLALPLSTPLVSRQSMVWRPWRLLCPQVVLRRRIYSV